MTSIAAINNVLPAGQLRRQLVSFGAIGIVSTIAYVGVYALLREAIPAPAANALALVVTAVGNTEANRRLTFSVGRSQGQARDHAAGLVALAVAMAITSASLAVLPIIAPHHGRLSEIAVLVAANAVATLVRFLLLRLAMERGFERRRRVPPTGDFATLAEPTRKRG
jgi:putative flippase GtrA